MDEKGNACISDFGITVMLHNTGVLTQTTSSVRGTLRWMAPELLLDDTRKPSFEADMWSLGMTFLVRAMKHPFHSFLGA